MIITNGFTGADNIINQFSDDKDLRGQNILILIDYAMFPALYISNFICDAFSFECMLVSDCTRMCDNGGSLNTDNCICDCVNGFSEGNCESENHCRLEYRKNHTKLPCGGRWRG